MSDYRDVQGFTAAVRPGDAVSARDPVAAKQDRVRQAARQQWLATQNAYDLLSHRVTPEDMDILYYVSRHAFRRVFLSGGLAEFNYLANLNR